MRDPKKESGPITIASKGERRYIRGKNEDPTSPYRKEKREKYHTVDISGDRGEIVIKLGNTREKESLSRWGMEGAGFFGIVVFLKGLWGNPKGGSVDKKKGGGERKGISREALDI